MMFILNFFMQPGKIWRDACKVVVGRESSPDTRAILVIKYSYNTLPSSLKQKKVFFKCLYEGFDISAKFVGRKREVERLQVYIEI